MVKIFSDSYPNISYKNYLYKLKSSPNKQLLKIYKIYYKFNIIFRKNNIFTLEYNKNR